MRSCARNRVDSQTTVGLCESPHSANYQKGVLILFIPKVNFRDGCCKCRTYYLSLIVDYWCIFVLNHIPENQTEVHLIINHPRP